MHPFILTFKMEVNCFPLNHRMSLLITPHLLPPSSSFVLLGLYKSYQMDLKLNFVWTLPSLSVLFKSIIFECFLLH